MSDAPDSRFMVSTLHRIEASAREAAWWIAQGMDFHEASDELLEHVGNLRGYLEDDEATALGRAQNGSSSHPMQGTPGDGTGSDDGILRVDRQHGPRRIMGGRG